MQTAGHCCCIIKRDEEAIFSIGDYAIRATAAGGDHRHRQDMASRMTMPKPSSSEGRANTLASWYRRTSSSRDGEATYSTLSRTPSEFALAKKIRGCGRAGKHLPNVAAHFLRQERIGGHQQPDILSGNMEEIWEIWGLSPVPARWSTMVPTAHPAKNGPHSLTRQ